MDTEVSSVNSEGISWSAMADAWATGDMANAIEAAADKRGEEGAVNAEGTDAWLC